MLDRFDINAKAAIFYGQLEMQRLGHNFVGTEAIIAGVLMLRARPDSLKHVVYDEYVKAMEKEIGRGAGIIYDTPFTESCKKAISDALLHNKIIDINVLTNAILRDPSSTASKIIESLA